MTNPSREERLYQRLENLFQPSFLEIINESDKHHGHAGSPNTRESHYQVRIASSKFQGFSLRESHQQIYQALGGEFDIGLHALSIKIISDKDRKCRIE